MQSKNSSKQRNTVIQGLRSFRDTLPKNAKKIINKKGHIFSETLNNWKYIVGDELFKICYPKLRESDINNIVPTTSTSFVMMLCDCIATTIMNIRKSGLSIKENNVVKKSEPPPVKREGILMK